MSDKDEQPTQSRSDPESDRLFFNDDPELLKDSVIRIAEIEARARETRREQDKKDRVEWITHSQQKLMFMFLVFVIALICISSSWAMYIFMSYGNSHQVELAKDIFKVLMESGIAAAVGFFAIKAFEK